MAQPRRRTSLDRNYRHGDLSVFPQALDSAATLFEARNNAQTTLRHNLTPNARYIIVDDAAGFPASGYIRLAGPDGTGTPELIHYAYKIGNQFHGLQRAVEGMRQGSWRPGSVVTAPVAAEHHNALKDAVLKVQAKIGDRQSADANTLFGQVMRLEQRWLTPKAGFRAFPRVGPPALKVSFHNFSTGFGNRYLWDFGDGATSKEVHPVHEYTAEGGYTVRLDIITSTGGRGLTEKAGYVQVNGDERQPFFYAAPLAGPAAAGHLLVDQTDGAVTERHWFFGDGQDEVVDDPNAHTVRHVYQPGVYSPTLLVRFADGRQVRGTVLDPLTAY